MMNGVFNPAAVQNGEVVGTFLLLKGKEMMKN